VPYKFLKPILAYKRLKSPSGLKGTPFVSPSGNPFTALRLLSLQARHGGKYAPPSVRALYAQAVEALAKMECPDFSDTDDETVYAAFVSMYATAPWRWRLDAETQARRRQ